MQKVLKPGRVQGEITVPSSKSYAHRAFIALALSKGQGKIHPVDLSKDLLATLKCLEDMGVDFILKGKEVHMDARGFGVQRDRVLKPEESGSTLRFFIPLTLLFQDVYEFRGSTGLMRRPLSVYEELFQDQEVMLYKDSPESLVVKGKLLPGHYTMRGDVSSQFVSGILFALPLLDGDSTLTVTGTLESADYVAMTLQVMEDFGVYVQREGNHFFIKGHQRYQERDYEVEGDYSQGAFFLAMGALKGDVTVKGLSHDSLQGDRAMVRILEKMGAIITPVEKGYHVVTSSLQGLSVDISGIPDLTPVLAVVFALSEGEGRIEKCQRLQYKESNRIVSTLKLLEALGGEAYEKEGTLIIRGKKRLTGGVVDAYQDHRIVMAAAVASLCTEAPVIIDGYEAVSKSYPRFFEDFEKLQGKLYENNP